MQIIFSSHSEDKLELLAERGIILSKEQVVDCLESPDKITEGYNGRKIAQKGLDAEHILRVVFTATGEAMRVITMYPARRSRYED